MCLVYDESMSSKKPQQAVNGEVVAKNLGGRPMKYQSEAQLQEAIDDYFDQCDNRIVQVFSKKIGDVVEINDPEPYTVSGLAYAMGVDRDTLLNYAKDERFFGAIKRAKNKVHLDVERRLMERNATGAIFNLKNNFGWKDEQVVKNEVDITTTHTVPPEMLEGFTAYLEQQTKTGK